MIFLSLMAFALILGGFVFFVLPQAKTAHRAVSAGVFLVLTLLVFGGVAELLGRPKPIRLEWREITKAQVVGSLPVENEAIYLWLALPGAQEPRTYVLPWDMTAAQQLQDAMNAAEEADTAVEMALPSGGGRDAGERMFWARPQPPMPAKDRSAMPIN